MFKPLLSALLLAVHVSLAVAQTPQVCAGTLHQIPNFKSRYLTPRHVDIWLPEGYTPKREYAVLYLHDGQMLFDSSTTWNKQAWDVDDVATQLLREGRVPNFIVVGIWNGGTTRHSEYFPQKPFESLPLQFRDSLYRDPKPLFDGRVHSDLYLKFIVRELKPWVDRHYSTHRDRAHTFIGGSSMGGLISLYALCEYPKVFGGAACLSTHWPGIFRVENNPIPAAFVAYLQKKLPNPATHRLYFDYGTATLDALYEPFQQQVDAVLRTKGYTDANWVTRKFEGEDHSEKAWKRRLDQPLVFLLKG